MFRPFPTLAGCCLLVWTASLPGAAPRPAPPRVDPAAVEFFEKNVRPILVQQCQECHGPRKQRGGLRLDSREAVLAGGDSGPSVVPGKPEQSLLVKVLAYHETPKMPPAGKLPAAQVTVLTEWVRRGLPWPDTAAVVRPATPERTFQITARDRTFWSFQPVGQPAVPSVRAAQQALTSIDRFLLAALEARGLQPVAPADRRTLIRRVTFDLIGLPPTPEEVDAFVRDERPDAYERLVDRLLASPHYGERWARHWLDVARYGEDQAHTFQARKYPQGFRYRDWLVKAFNDDLPYDRFIIEQIAADLIDGPTRLERLPALGFFSLGPVYYGDPRKLDQIDDRIDTLTRGLLGLTVACARCHDHKYDPISSKDYYALAGVIASTDYVEVAADTGAVIEPPPRKTNNQTKKPAPPRGPFIHALREMPRPTTMRVHLRGNPATLGEEAPRRFLAILGGSDERPFTQGSGRLELARAIASKDNPLTARVMVNRIWRHHFGKGLVRTPSNFGSLGERPTHPELLDYLARRFMDSGWSIKTLHRDIVLSAAYRQSSQVDDRAGEIDPENRLVWRMNRRRLEVEAWRDAMLSVSGALDRTLGGPSAELNAADNRRRTYYGVVSRHELNPLLRLFDFPDPNLTSAERPETTVPLQQLFVLNSEFMVSNARALVTRLQRSARDDAGRIQEAFRLLYARPATPRELSLGIAFLSGKDAPDTQASLTRWERYAQALLATNEFLYVD